ncbi:hypothetical protein OPV22_018436 [Ensete ventricosum]|uniref:Uncharacterized protein n=1 Tax=Ensete ventricosum TaxID=4639 RepID=A0AAV8PFU7_ENSVE|nr:hypothetical protein OPV22_018436 [Ensete ventricosum]
MATNGVDKQFTCQHVGDNDGGSSGEVVLARHAEDISRLYSASAWRSEGLLLLRGIRDRPHPRNEHGRTAAPLRFGSVPKQGDGMNTEMLVTLSSGAHINRTM